MAKGYVYFIRFQDSPFFYIGSTANVERRLYIHKLLLSKGQHHNTKMQELWDAGHTTLHESKWEFATVKEAREAEESAIKSHKLCDELLNIGLGSEGGDNLTRNPNRLQIIEKIKGGLRRRYANRTDEQIRMASEAVSGEKNPMFGRTHTAEVREKLSKANTGNTYCVGYKHTDSFREKQSALAKLRVGEKNPFFGKQHTEEFKRKLSGLRMGKLPSNTNEIEIDGIRYKSQSEAARTLGVCVATITHRIKSTNPKYANYKVLSRELGNDQL